KIRSRFVCQSCGATSPRWIGKCPECGAWESYVEEVIASSAPIKGRGARTSSGAANVVSLEDVTFETDPRISTGIDELDRVLGGGVMAGSVVLVGGDPGVGKSTLMAQMCSGLGERKVLYVTGEESLAQVKL